MSLKLRLPALAGLFFIATSLFSLPASAVFQLIDGAPTSAPDYDLRAGHVQPSSAQLNLVKGLRAQAKWNRYGTVHTLTRHGGFLATGLAGKPADAARQWIKQNRDLFRLSDQSVDDLELINDGVTPYNDAHALLFRQRFGGLAPSGGEGQIVVGIVNGKVYWVSSTSAGDQPMPTAATISPLAAWRKAAADVHRNVVESDVKAVRNAKAIADGGDGWNLFQVLGFTQPQRARLVALPMPQGGVRQTYETVVVDSQGGAAMAYVHYVDATTGQILRRENRMYNAANAVVPSIFSGSFETATSCAAPHEYSVTGSNASVAAAAVAILPTNALKLKLYSVNAEGAQTLVATSAATTGPVEVLTYNPSGGVPEGTYRLEACSQESFLSMAPYNYSGVFAALPLDTSITSVLLGASADAPQWKFFATNPSQNYEGADVRQSACFAPLPEGGLSGCTIGVDGPASKAPWDVLYGLVPTFTTIGNNAITAGGAYSPLTPSIPNPPLALTRKYDFPFNNAWHESGCSPAGIIVSQIPNSNGNDLSAVTVNLFAMHNRMHDFSYYLGFTEKNYNLQLYNYGLTPITQQNDPEIGTAQSGALVGHPALPTFGTLPGRNNANQIALMDGVPGITNQYLFQPVSGMIYSPCTDGALDTGIAGHEYTHAISNRMAGGPDGNLLGLQAGSMGESWGDLNATEYQLANGFEQPDGYSPTALAGYTTGHPERGIRVFNLADNPLNYGNMGFDTPGPEVHSDGEIWNGTQWELRTALNADYDAQFPSSDKRLQIKCANGGEGPNGCPGNRRWIQLVYDAWLLLPGNTSMLDARDAMLAADVARFDGANQKTMWRVFAKRGMGVNAYTIDTEDPAPVPSFESPLEDEKATVTFKVNAGDEADAAITNARVIVGQFATRSRQIADTDPTTVVDATDDITRKQTLNLADSANFVPGSYDFVVTAPGYGIHYFRNQQVKAGSSTITFSLPTNWASITKGASVTTSASLAENIALADTLIDDSEDTGAIIGDEGKVVGAWVTIDLGGERKFSHLNLSNAAGPTNAGRLQAIRQFELRTCSGECSNPETDFETVAYASAEDAFPSPAPRPQQTDLNLRSFDFPEVTATHVQIRVVHSQCSGGPLYQGDVDGDPLNNTDCMSAPVRIAGLNAATGGSLTIPAAGSYVRTTDIQLFSSAPKSSATGGESSKEFRFGGALQLGLLLPLLMLAGLRRRRRS